MDRAKRGGILQLRRFCIFLLCAMMFISVVAAHPGDTDSQGGHYVQDTGEYHYHHGYPAHDHKDIDGDGDIDCPYDFDDQTGRNSGTSSGNKYTSPGSSTQDNDSFSAFLLIALPFFLGFASGYFTKRNSAKKEIARIEKYHALRVDDLSSRIEEKSRQAEKLATDVEALRAFSLDEHHRFNALWTLHLRMKQAPSGMYFAPDGLPVFLEKAPRKRYGEFTVYYNARSRIYHTNPKCSPSVSLSERHIFELIGSSKPCKKCVRSILPEKIPDWYDIKPSDDSLPDVLTLPKSK